ncbi:Hda2p [Kluyveromyces lactis]|uniref:KLLA0C10483p n=1 Tax=Kluyveromyces lactis (strain ATCC 8585 / CBS 2359 / DSM 70799 / NBRC 1267 / NRRL Y-1140 / WM37) TaxID=284590 RepID=Q6CTS2_KLULA|nr:uncharacterized protein KLLA0_C10483g [Kluyveromyces lactis]CAH01518.1 KLLA0C10483p [Kluyveromyces lactis]|eukprot:XP_452667.1 uncharacterized protein KLLA0_C10483g [Kluyveromyces lactis]
MNSTSNRTQVFYIPVGLTQVQKDLLEILISIHAESFVSCVDKRLLPELQSKLEKKGTNLKRDLSMTALTDVQLTEWFFENIRAVSNHPCLLVEHYMPRQFLLMEPTERLIYTSDKFGKLNLMVDLLLNRKDKSRPLQVAIISHSVKELDLIEGVMLGKVAKLKRLSGTSLFDEKHEYDDQTSGSRTTNGENSSSSGSVAPEQIGKSKDEYNYSKSRRKNNISQLDWLFLATTTHLTHSEDLLSRYNLDLIISFDPMLDESLPSIFKVRKNGRKTPLFKLLVQDSPDHYLLSKKKPTTTSEKLILDSIVHFLKYRADIKDLISLQQYENIIDSLIKETDPGEFLPSVNPGSSRNNDDLIPFLTNPMELMPLTYGKYELRLQSGPMDIKNYQYILKTLTAERLKQCHVEYEEREKLVLKTRLKETKRLNDFDDLKVNIGQHFKKLKENETKINDSEKRVERTRSELEVLEERLKSLVERKSELVRLLTLEDIAKEIENQKQQHTKLSDEVSSFKKSNDEESFKNDDLRSSYQQKSSEAASEVLKTSALKAEKEELERQLNGPFTKWELIILQEKEAQLKSSLRKMVQQSQFLIQYMNRIQGQYNIENEPAKKSSPATNNSSRYTTRTTRATSPTYT